MNEEASKHSLACHANLLKGPGGRGIFNVTEGLHSIYLRLHQRMADHNAGGLGHESLPPVFPRQNVPDIGAMGMGF